MTEYTFPLSDIEFTLQHLVGFDDLCRDCGASDSNFELATAVLAEAGKFATQVLAPLNWTGDQAGTELTDRGVQEAPGFNDAYQAFVESGWPTLSFAEQYGGQGLPNVLAVAVNEAWQSSNLALGLCPLLGQGAVEALMHHGSEQLQRTWLPKMVSGEWTGTMNLTEPQAGTDLAAVKTRAVPNGDHYLITGQKIYITWGDHQMTPNIVHLVLARLPDAPEGVKGISLFIVPKFLLDENGEPGQRNDAHCISIEHKLGIHASPTCTMSFGENGGAVGYLVGEAHQGLSYMFTMMNHARQGVGMQGLGVAERSYQKALEYAQERIQGSSREGKPLAIFEHPDVRRMLMTMRSATEAMRALVLLAAAEVDRAEVAGDGQQARQARVELYTPIVKGWITELAQEITYLGVQVHGGMGFVEETGIAQQYRDARILTIYEGTTGVQALDLVGRKVMRNKGESMQALLAEIEQFSSGFTVDAAAAQSLKDALTAAHTATDWLLAQANPGKPEVGAVSVPYMMLMGYLCGGWLICQQAQIAAQMLADKQGDPKFYDAKIATARFYCDHLLVRVHSLCREVTQGANSVMSLDADAWN